MADFSALKQTIQAYIKQNGNEEITGNILQDVLLAMVTTMGDGAINTLTQSLQNEITVRGNADTALGGRIDGLQTTVNAINTKMGEGYVYAGIATPSTNPGTISGKVFYIAVQAGTYTNLGGTVVTEGITILKYNGTSWVKEQALFTDGGVFDISAYHAIGGTLAKYVDLAEALNGGANIPQSLQKGGMSVKFVQSSDNIYVQYRLTKNQFSTAVTDWQGEKYVEENAAFGQYVGRPRFTYGRIEPNTSTSDGYKVLEPVNRNYVHSQILTNVLTLNPNGRSVVVLDYDKEGTFIGVEAGSTNIRKYNRKNIRLMVPINYPTETVDTINGLITVTCSTESDTLDITNYTGSEKVMFYQGNVNQSLSPINEGKYCHSIVLHNVKSITPTTGYEIAPIGMDKDGNYVEFQVYQWYDTRVTFPINIKSVVFNIRKTDLSDLLAKDVNADPSSYITIERYTDDEKEILHLTNTGYTKRNIKTTYYGINNTGNIYFEQNNRLHSGFIDNCIAVYCNEGYEIAVVCFDENGSRIETFYAWEQCVLFDKEYRVRFNVRKKGDTTDFTSEQKADAEANVFVYTSTLYLGEKKLSILGDSLSTFGDNPESQYSNGTWTYAGNRCFYPKIDGDNRFIRDIDKMWFKRVIDNFGLTLDINESYAGTTISNIRSGNLISSQTRINHLGENGTPDFILIFAGTNDLGDAVTVGTFNNEDPSNYTDEQIAALPVNTFADAYRTMLIRVQKTYPESKVIVIMPDFTNGYYTTEELDEYIEVIKEECDYFGVPIINIRTAGINTFNMTNYIPDGIHFNITGAEMIYERVALFLENNIYKF